LSKAVLRRDKVAVVKILANQPEYLESERNIFGHSAVHLAIGWPEGLEILLKAVDEAFLHREFDIRDPPCHTIPSSKSSTPLDYAIAFGCTRSIRLLAEANTAFDFKWNLFIGTPSLPENVSEIVLDVVVERLQQLFEFAVQKLPSATISSLGITCFELFHSKAEQVLKYLEEENIQLPRKFNTKYYWNVFWLEDGGLYHQSDISAETAIIFFNAGFKDIDSEVEGITPIMNLSSPSALGAHEFVFSRYFRMVEFFVQKGARLDRQIPLDLIDNQVSNDEPTRHHRAVHWVAIHAWEKVLSFDFFDISAIAELGSSQIWQNILQRSISDPCSCACASGGCRPITLALKYSERRNWGKWTNLFRMNKRKNPFETNWEDLLSNLSPMYRVASVELLFKLSLLLDGLEGDQLVDDVIRYLTFSALGMTHTCCKHLRRENFTRTSREYGLRKREPSIRMMDPAEAEEIHEEERTLIERLEILHTKFMEDFRRLGVPLSRFILENWRETMSTELSNSREISESLRDQFSELGISMYTEPDSNEIYELVKLSDTASDSYTRYDLQEWLQKNERDIVWIQQYLKNNQNECNDPNEDYKQTYLRDLLKQLQLMAAKITS
jgi:hypothetical protein